jgi:uncharacterized SAM-binding protein YcdF (DUF218 family)
VVHHEIAARRRFPLLLKFTLGLAVIAALVYFTRELWLPAMGYALIHSDQPEKAEIAVVLAGDSFGRRLEKSAQLIQAGYVPQALVSGPPGMYGVNESDMAVQFIVREGYPPQWFVSFPDPSHSTREEAWYVLRELRRRNIHSFLLVTSDYHTARSRRIYLATERELGYTPQFRTIAAADEYFHAASWWRSREAQKTVFMEWWKTVATALGK